MIYHFSKHNDTPLYFSFICDIFAFLKISDTVTCNGKLYTVKKQTISKQCQTNCKLRDAAFRRVSQFAISGKCCLLAAPDRYAFTTIVRISPLDIFMTSILGFLS